MDRERTAKDVGIVMGGNFLSLLLGLASSVTVAAYFGVGKQLDAFMAAYMFPDILGQLVSSVSMLVLIPVFLNKKITEGENVAWETINKINTICLLFLSVGTIAFITFSPLLIRIAAPGFNNDTFALSCRLLRILSFSVLLLGCSALASSLLQAHNHFTAPSLSRPLTQIFVIGVILLFSRSLGIYAYAIGTVVGLLVGAFIQIPPLISKGRLRLDFDLSHSNVKSTFFSLPILILARVMNHGTNIAITAFASTLVVGSISALTFAWKIVSIPMMVTSSLSVVLYTAISQEIAKKDFIALKRILMKAIKLSIYIGVPFTIFFLFFRVPIVRMLFERGRFNSEQSLLTAEVLMFYCLMIVFQSVNLLIGNAYWALGLMRIRLKIEVAGIIVCILSCLLLSKYLGAGGLALSISTQYIFLTVIGLKILKERVLNDFDTRGLISYGFKVTLASVLSGLTTKMLMDVFPGLGDAGLVGKIGYIVCLGVIGAGSYMLFCFSLKIEENREMLALFMNKVMDIRRKLKFNFL